MTNRIVLSLVASLSASVMLYAGGQAPPTRQLPTFRSGVHVVEVDAVVHDRDDNFVPGLTKDDFEVLEDGKPREIATVSMLNLPVDRRGKPIDVAADRSAAVGADSSADMGRVYVLILNNGKPDRVRSIGREFVEGFLGPTDLVAVMYGNGAAPQGLTNDKASLLAAIDRFSFGGNRGVKMMREAAIHLNAVGGRRKAILFVSDDAGLTPPDPNDLIRGPDVFWMLPEAQKEYKDAVQTINRNNVRVYPIDPRGFIPRPGVSGGGEEGAPLPTVSTHFNGETMAARAIASDTGGIAIVNTNFYDRNFPLIVRDNSAYYVLAFYSLAELDGRFHDVKVRVKARADLSVRARSGYQATTPDVKGSSVKLPKNLSASARDALRPSAAVVTGLPLELFTAVFQADGYEGSLLIGCHVPGALLKLAPKDQIELSYVAVDRWGTVRAVERRAFTLTFGDEGRAKVEQNGLRIFGRLTLPRGSYEIRVAANQPGGATGSAVAEVEIPDYTALPLSVSDLVVASSRGPALTTLEEDPLLRRAMPAQPTPSRRFPSAATMTVFAEIYNAQWILTRDVGVTTTIRSSDGRVMVRQEQTVTSGDRGRAYYTGRIPLTKLGTGEYVLTLETYTSHGPPASASQQIRFNVE